MYRSHVEHMYRITPLDKLHRFTIKVYRVYVTLVRSDGQQV
jgi:hypothetical protein